MLVEYDWSDAVRGRHRHLVGCGCFRLLAELHPCFRHGDQVDAALRQWVEEHRPLHQLRRAMPGLESERRFVARNGLVRSFWFARDLTPFFPTEDSVNEALLQWLAEHRPRGRARPRRRSRSRRART